MTLRTTLLVLLATLFASSCTPTRPFASATAAWTRCNTTGPGNRCDVVIVQDANGPHVCPFGRVRVEPEFLEFTGGRPVNVQWGVSEPLAFCNRDGIDLKDGFAGARRQVWENYNSDNKEGSRIGLASADDDCRQFRNWRWGNENPGSEYAYEIRIRDKRTNQRCTIDPWFKNG